MKKILVPTDFSDYADYALDAAIKLAKKTNASIHVLHFMSIPIDWLGLDNSQTKMYPDITKKVNQTNHKLDALVDKARNSDVEATKFLGYNESYTSIIQHIEKHHIDMVVMGSKGTSGVKEIIIGSVTQKVVRLSPVPVLVVKDHLTTVDEVNFVMVAGFDEDMDRAFDKLVNFARLVSAKVHLLFVNTPLNFTSTDKASARMAQYAERGGDLIESVNIYNAYSFEEGVKKFTEGIENSIIAMATHSRRGIDRFVSGSLTEQMVNHIQEPLLSFHLQ
ncbi:MAG: universal stress protein [Bacteroidota bacterium]